jgi:hypothetical protein
VPIGVVDGNRGGLGVQPDEHADTFARMFVGEPDCVAMKNSSRCVLGGGAGSTWSGWFAVPGVIAAYSTAQRCWVTLP